MKSIRRILFAAIALYAVMMLTACNPSASNTSGSSSSTGAGGYEMPNESDESFSDYVKRVDPDLYKDLEDIYGSLG